MSRAAGAIPQPRERDDAVALNSNNYLVDSARPLTSLLFILPLLIIHEAGMVATAQSATPASIRAFGMMRGFFDAFGATARWLPAMAVVSILIIWHMARGDRWHVSSRRIGWMYAESIAWMVPLLTISYFVARGLALSIHAAAPDDPGQAVVLSIGAGIYEELVFRLGLFTLLHTLFKDGLRWKPKATAILMVSISALLFSGYHYLGSELFSWRSFAFRTIAGLYFGVIFLYRGFGITAGLHAFYDVAALTLVL